jgi:hypothetical protein
MPDKPINFGARFAYLKAIEAHWPEVFKSLRDTTFPLYRNCWERNGKRFAIKKPRPSIESFAVGPSKRLPKRCTCFAKVGEIAWL